MIVSVINEEFKELYENYSIDEISEYSKQKDKLFGRYRTIAEMLGIILIKRAKEMNMNIMVETSGRDISSFVYIDHLFPDNNYRKLVMHFTINNIIHAEKSVDSRMLREIENGKQSVISSLNDVRNIIKVNQGNNN